MKNPTGIDQSFVGKVSPAGVAVAGILCFATPFLLPLLAIWIAKPLAPLHYLFLRIPQESKLVFLTLVLPVVAASLIASASRCVRVWRDARGLAALKDGFKRMSSAQGGGVGISEGRTVVEEFVSAMSYCYAWRILQLLVRNRDRSNVSFSELVDGATVRAGATVRTGYANVVLLLSLVGTVAGFSGVLGELSAANRSLGASELGVVLVAGVGHMGQAFGSTVFGVLFAVSCFLVAASVDSLEVRVSKSIQYYVSSEVLPLFVPISSEAVLDEFPRLLKGIRSAIAAASKQSVDLSAQVEKVCAEMSESAQQAADAYRGQMTVSIGQLEQVLRSAGAYMCESVTACNSVVAELDNVVRQNLGGTVDEFGSHVGAFESGMRGVEKVLRDLPAATSQFVHGLNLVSKAVSDLEQAVAASQREQAKLGVQVLVKHSEGLQLYEEIVSLLKEATVSLGECQRVISNVYVLVDDVGTGLRSVKSQRAVM